MRGGGGGGEASEKSVDMRKGEDWSGGLARVAQTSIVVVGHVSIDCTNQNIHRTDALSRSRLNNNQPSRDAVPATCSLRHSLVVTHCLCVAGFHLLGGDVIGPHGVGVYGCDWFDSGLWRQRSAVLLFHS